MNTNKIKRLFVLDKDIVYLFKQICKEKGLKMSYIVNSLIKEFVEKEKRGK